MCEHEREAENGHEQEHEHDGHGLGLGGGGETFSRFQKAVSCHWKIIGQDITVSLTLFIFNLFKT
jgi:hypothetical protein